MRAGIIEEVSKSVSLWFCRPVRYSLTLCLACHSTDNSVLTILFSLQPHLSTPSLTTKLIYLASEEACGERNREMQNGIINGAGKWFVCDFVSCSRRIFFPYISLFLHPHRQLPLFTMIFPVTFCAFSYYPY